MNLGGQFNMIILGNIIHSKGMLVATEKGISLVNSQSLYAKLKQNKSNMFSSVAFKDRVSRRVKSNLALNKDGLISKRYGTPLLIKTANTNTLSIGPCVINGVNIGKGFVITVESYEETTSVGNSQYREKFKWIPRVIVCFPEVGISFNYTGQCEGLELLNSNLKVFRICKEFTEVYSGWKYAYVAGDTIQLIGLYGTTIHNFITQLWLDKIIKIPVLDLVKKTVFYDKGTCFCSYAGELATAWLGSNNPTRYKILRIGNVYKITYYSDYEKTEVKYSVALMARNGNVLVSNTVVNIRKGE